MQLGMWSLDVNSLGTTALNKLGYTDIKQNVEGTLF